MIGVERNRVKLPFEKKFGGNWENIVHLLTLKMSPIDCKQKNKEQN